MKKRQVLIIALVASLLIGTGCNRPNTAPSSKPSFSVQQQLLDSIQALIAQQEWYAAHSALVHHQLQYPTKEQQKVQQLKEIVRKSFNAQQINAANNSPFESIYETYMKGLRQEIDEIKQRAFYHAPNSTLYVNEDVVKTYLNVPFDTLQQPRLQFTVQNVSELQHQLNYIQFSIDKQIYPYLPQQTFSDRGYGYHWQWFDDEVEEETTLQLLEKIATAKGAQVIFYFQNNYKEERTITPEEQTALSTILTAYANITNHFKSKNL